MNLDLTITATFESVFTVLTLAVLVVAVVAAWASGATWRDITGIGDTVSTPDAARYVEAFAEGLTCVNDLEGVGWFDSPVPPRLHRCWPQTVGLNAGSYVERCPCGGIRLSKGGPWMERNSR